MNSLISVNKKFMEFSPKKLVEMIKNIPSIRILNEKDYIKNPKASG